MKFLKTIIAVFSICAGLVSCTEEKIEETTYSILFLENPVMVGSNGGASSCAFVSDYQWTAEAVSKWITDVTVTDGELNFTVEANPYEDTRNGKIRLTVIGDDYTADLTIRQLGNTGKLKVETTNVSLATIGEKLEIKISSGENWTPASTADWLSAVRKNSTTLELSAKPNYLGSVLTADVTVQTASGKEKAVIKVTQKADNADFANASTPQTREFVYKSDGLVSQIVQDKFYTVGDHVNAIEIQFRNIAGSSISPYSIFMFEVDLTGDVTILASCSNDDPSSIKKTDNSVNLEDSHRMECHS